MNTYEYRHASTVRKNAILPGDVHPALRSTSNSIARNALDAGLPAPVFPVATPKNDSAVLPVGSEFFINQVWDAYRVSAGHRSQLTITEARERYEASLIARRAMEIRADNYRIGGPEAAFMAKREVEFTPKPSDKTIGEVIATARVIPHTNTDGFGFTSGPVAEEGLPAGEFGVLGAYDGHPQSVGRIVVDATWHHWFNVNLRGFDTASAHFAQIRNYYWNVALWLAGKDKQQAMFNTAVHGLVRLQPWNELSPATDVGWLGFSGLDAIGRRASQCVAVEWLLDRLPWKLRERFRWPPVPGPRADPARSASWPVGLPSAPRWPARPCGRAPTPPPAAVPVPPSRGPIAPAPPAAAVGAC